MRYPVPDPVLPGQESAWSYPRPAIAQRCSSLILIEHRGLIVARTRHAIRVLETSHPPSYYIPPDEIASGVLRASAARSFCEWKGTARFWNVKVDGDLLREAGWSYSDPTSSFAILRDHVSFYAGLFDRCSVDGETVTPQSGAFYGGWITSRVAGPFKGEPGSDGW